MFQDMIWLVISCLGFPWSLQHENHDDHWSWAIKGGILPTITKRFSNTWTFLCAAWMDRAGIPCSKANACPQPRRRMYTLHWQKKRFGCILLVYIQLFVYLHMHIWVHMTLLYPKKWETPNTTYTITYGKLHSYLGSPIAGWFVSWKI